MLSNVPNFGDSQAHTNERCGAGPQTPHEADGPADAAGRAPGGRRRRFRAAGPRGVGGGGFPAREAEAPTVAAAAGGVGALREVSGTAV